MKRLFLAVLLCLLVVGTARADLLSDLMDRVPGHSFTWQNSIDVVFSESFQGPGASGAVQIIGDGFTIQSTYTLNPAGVYFNIDGVTLRFIMVNGQLMLVPIDALMLDPVN